MNVDETSMWASAITAYLHYLGFMLAFGSLAVESLTLKPDLSVRDGWRVVVADGVYGLSATLVLITGVLRVLYFGKGTDFYLSDSTFYIKVGLFILIGLLSLYPTFSFLSWIPDLRNGNVPGLELPQVQRLSRMIQIELAGFILIPLLAAMMARGMAFV